MTAPAWHDDRACRDLPVDVFFPVATYGAAGPGKQSPDYGPALAVCNRCPAKAECRAQAEHDGDIVDGRAVHGVIAGVAPRQPGKPTPPLRRVCALPECDVKFYASAAGLKHYCSTEHSAEGHRRALARARKEPDHGTAAGYKQHKRLGQEACAMCKAANAWDVQHKRPSRRTA